MTFDLRPCPQTLLDLHIAFVVDLDPVGGRGHEMQGSKGQNIAQSDVSLLQLFQLVIIHDVFTSDVYIWNAYSRGVLDLRTWTLFCITRNLT